VLGKHLPEGFGKNLSLTELLMWCNYFVELFQFILATYRKGYLV